MNTNMTDEKWEQLRLDAVEHVVHDYTNFISSGLMAITQRQKKEWLLPPVNTHTGHAFLLNCRKMADFFLNSSGRASKNDIMSKHYLEKTLKRKERTFRLDLWQREWSDAMDKQLMHLSYVRVGGAKPWEGHEETKTFLRTFQAAWKLFLSKLETPFKEKFEEEIIKRQQPNEKGEPSEFRDVDLRGNQEVDDTVGHP